MDTFRRKKDAESWALEVERRFDRGEELVTKRAAVARTFGDLIVIYVNDMIEVGKAPRGSKWQASLAGCAEPSLVNDRQAAARRSLSASFAVLLLAIPGG
ncbi:MAG: hypothetical protein QNJ30_02240 [Kiloniellales bacterium]|nr:hypothetical protein [Kiloniellales bacterium]